MYINFNEFNNVNDLIDAILDKISKDGFDKLTDLEKQTLNDHSKGKTLNIDDLKKTQKPTKKVVGKDSAKSFLSDITGTKESDWKNTEVIGIPPGGSMTIGIDNNLGRNSKKRFKSGDVVYPIDVSRGNLPEHAYEFILSSDEFIVIKLNDAGKLDIGCNRISNGKKKVFYYSTNRFSLNKEEVKWDNIEWDGNDDTYWDVDNKQDGVPGDYCFAVTDFEDGIQVALTAESYYRRENCLDDRLGGHNLSNTVKNSLRRVGVSPVEDMEAIFGVEDYDKTKEEIIQGLIEEGFVNDPGFRNWLEKEI